MPARTEGAAPPRRVRRGAPEARPPGRCALPTALLIALLASPAAAGDSFLDRTAPVQEAVPYGMALEPAPASTPAPTPAAAATPAAGD